MKFNFRKHFITQLLMVVAVIGMVAALAIPARAQVTTRDIRAFTNAPTFLNSASVSNISNISYTNAVPIYSGRDVLLISEATAATNSLDVPIVWYLGFTYAGTNTATTTNITFAALPNKRVATNLPSAILNGANGLFLFSAANPGTNSQSSVRLLRQQ